MTVTSRIPAAAAITQFRAYRPISSTATTAATFPPAIAISARNGRPRAASRAAAANRRSASSAKGIATKTARAAAASHEVLSRISASSSVNAALAHARCCAAPVLRLKLWTNSATTPPTSSSPATRSGSAAHNGVSTAATADSPVKMARAGVDDPGLQRVLTAAIPLPVSRRSHESMDTRMVTW